MQAIDTKGVFADSDADASNRKAKAAGVVIRRTITSPIAPLSETFRPLLRGAHSVDQLFFLGVRLSL
jgi:hypothetical protein